MADLKRSALFELHGAMEAKMAPVAGWAMPLQYPGGSISEVSHTLEHCSLFDFSHSGKLRVAGSSAAAALDSLLLYGTEDLPELGCRQDLLIGGDGLIIADLTVCRMAAGDFFLLTNPVNTAAAAAGLQKYLPPETVTDLTQELAIFDLLGPATPEVTEFLEIPPEQLPEKGRLQIVSIDGVNIILCRTENSAGADGYRFIFRRDHAVDLWEMILEYPSVDPAGFNAAEILRLEAGYPISLRMITPGATPVEAGFIDSVEELDDRLKGKAALQQAVPRFRTVMAETDGRNTVYGGTRICDGNGKDMGEVLTGVYSPISNRSIAICRLNGSEAAAGDTPLFFEKDGKSIAGRRINTVFLK